MVTQNKRVREFRRGIQRTPQRPRDALPASLTKQKANPTHMLKTTANPTCIQRTWYWVSSAQTSRLGKDVILPRRELYIGKPGLRQLQSLMQWGF
jgi:hypothetical protein